MKYLRERRGQAFETMMLVISVIIAVAILGILTGFLANINIGSQSAKDTITTLLKQVESKNIGSASTDGATFAAADIITAVEVIQGTSIQSTKIKFKCSDPSFCSDSTAPMTTTDTKITVTSKAKGYIFACKGPADTNYHVCIGSSDTKVTVSSDCLTTCGLG